MIERFVIRPTFRVERAPHTLLSLSRQIGISMQTIFHFVAIPIFAVD